MAALFSFRLWWTPIACHATIDLKPSSFSPCKWNKRNSITGCALYGVRYALQRNGLKLPSAWHISDVITESTQIGVALWCQFFVIAKVMWLLRTTIYVDMQSTGLIMDNLLQMNYFFNKLYCQMVLLVLDQHGTKEPGVYKINPFKYMSCNSDAYQLTAIDFFICKHAYQPIAINFFICEHRPYWRLDFLLITTLTCT